MLDKKSNFLKVVRMEEYMKNVYKYALLIVIVLFCITSCDNTNDPKNISTVTVSLIASDTIEINGATVTLTLDGSTELIFRQTSSSSSRAVFTNVPFGAYFINVENADYITHSMHSLIVSNKNSSIDIPLFPSDEILVGGFGPAWGKIFYDKGYYSKGWRYLEVSSADYEFSAQWGTHGSFLSGTSRVIGAGRGNTLRILLRCIERHETGRAAQVCMDLDIWGFKDWFLPSRDELLEIYRHKAIDDGFSEERYWTSCQENAVGAWFIDFETGFPSAIDKRSEYRVRAVRAF
jgi:hypothetical protein